MAIGTVMSEIFLRTIYDVPLTRIHIINRQFFQSFFRLFVTMPANREHFNDELGNLAALCVSSQRRMK